MNCWPSFSPSFAAKRGIDDGALDDLIPRLQAAGQTAVVVASDGVAVGVLGIADVVRPQLEPLGLPVEVIEAGSE